MTVLILTKLDRNEYEYECERLIASFTAKGIEAVMCHPDDFDIVVDSTLLNKYN
jgi:hypothetical protein